MAHLYLASAPGPFSIGESVTLVGDEAHHASTVARLRIGEHTLVTDGVGSLAGASVKDVTKNVVALEVTEVHEVVRQSPEVWLAQALAKGDRDEAAIQMATEMGVDGVIPFAAARSVSVWRGDKHDKGVARWKKVVLEASKQSLRPWIPVVEEPLTAEGLAAVAPQWNVVVLVPGASLPLSAYRPAGDKPLLLVVGPEGGLESAEIDMLVAAGAIAVRLGDTVLRTSSAGPAALAMLNLQLGRW